MLLNDQPGMVVIGLSDRLNDLLIQMKGFVPDVLLLDSISSKQSIANLLTDLNQLDHRPRSIVFSASLEDIEANKGAGADYFILKNAPPDELLPILNDLWLSILPH